MVLPLYVTARKEDSDFTIELHVFSADSLERPDKKTEDQMHMFTQMNSRIQLAADSYDRYRKIMDTKFDRVFGNPPWGGVLKGPLAPVYDTAKKEHFARMFRSAARGKYDVYGLFVERSLQLLKTGGHFALLTQDTYLDKEWARGLRNLLASKARLDFIVDLNPFGQLFFHAMNAPCATAAAYTADESATDTECLCVTSHAAKGAFQELNTQQRREKVVETVRDVLGKLADRKKKAQVLFASGARIAQQKLRDTANDRWDLSGGPTKGDFPEGWFTAAELLEMRQGVTPGGCLDVFLMDKNRAKLLNLEDDLVHDAIKSKQLECWRVQWKNKTLFYPYHVKGKKSEPAFTIQWDEVKDERLKSRLVQISLDDALDFDKQIDSRELEIIRKTGINNEAVSKLLKHRIALGLVNYPAAAKYLVENYERLQSRVFKKKNIRDFNRRWYEYLWPRDATIMLAKQRILSPTLIRQVRFVLDTKGYLSDHACLMIQPTEKTKRAWEKFVEEMQVVVGEQLSKKELLQYCLAFLNSRYAQERLVTGHRPTPKGFYTITEAYLKEIPIPKPSDRRTAKQIIRVVDELERREFDLTEKREVEALEDKLEAAMADALNAVSAHYEKAARAD